MARLGESGLWSRGQLQAAPNFSRRDFFGFVFTPTNFMPIGSERRSFQYTSTCQSWRRHAAHNWYTINVLLTKPWGVSASGLVVPVLLRA